MTRLGILISGRGSNFQAIHQAIERGTLQAQIACVISNVPEASGLAYAHTHGLPTYDLDSKGVKRADFDTKLIEILRKANVDLVCLAGYMRLLSPHFIEAFRGRILNIHPSLLPAFPGQNAQGQALAAGVQVTGCTVHYVDEGLDSGPVIAQAQVPVLVNDTEQTLSARILEQEHNLYPAAIRQVITPVSRSTKTNVE